MTTSAERYPDLIGDQDDPALTRLIADLDQALRAPTPPAQLHSALQQLMDQRAGGHTAPAARSVPPLLSRKEALKVGAAGAALLLALGQPSAALANAAARAAAMDSPMTAARLVEIMRTERAEWDALLARVGEDRMAEPGVE